MTGKIQTLKGKRIWHLISNRWFSAITQYGLNSAKSLQMKGHLCLITCLDQSPAAQHAVEMGLDVSPVDSFKLLSLFKLRKIAQGFGPDVIFVYGGPEMALSRFIPGFGKQEKPVIRFRGQAVSDSNKRFPGLFKKSHAHVDLVLTPGNRLADHMKSALDASVPVRKMTLGIDTDRFNRPAVVKDLPAPELLLFGRFDPVKGHEKFIKIFSMMLDLWQSHESKNQPEPKLHIAGKPANISKSQMEEFARQCGLSVGRQVKITTGQIQEISKVMSSACIGVVSSVGSEEICRVAQEFLLCGTPVFVSGVGALNEVLFTDAGLSYEKRSDFEVAELLFHFILQSQKEDQVSRELRASMARSHFSLQAMGRDLNAALQFLAV